MLGALILAFVLVVAIPVAVLMSGAVLAAGLGFSLKSDAEAAHKGSELVDLNV